MFFTYVWDSFSRKIFFGYLYFIRAHTNEQLKNGDNSGITDIIHFTLSLFESGEARTICFFKKRFF